MTVDKIITWTTWSWVSSRLENVKRLLEACSPSPLHHPHPPRMPTKTTSLNFSYVHGEFPPSPPLLSDSVSPINVYLQWDCFWNVIKPTAFHFVRKYAVWSSNQMVHQSSSCLERTKFPSFSFEMGPLHWPMRRKSTTPKFCRCFSLPLPSEWRGKKATSPFFKRQISNSPPVLFTTGTKKGKNMGQTWKYKDVNLFEINAA